MFSHCGMATMLCTSDFDDQTQYAETDTHQSGQVDIPKYDEEIKSINFYINVLLTINTFLLASLLSS